MKTSRILKSTAAAMITGALLIAPQTPANAAMSDCPSGNICLWTGSQYTGTMKKVSTTGSYQAIGLATVNSYYNNRTKRTWLHSTTDGSGTYVCLNPGAKSASVSGWQETAKSVYLATITNC